MPLPGLGSEAQMTMSELILRVSLAFWVLLILTRIMGRKQMSQLTFFDYVTGISIGSIAAVMAVDNAIPLSTGLAALMAWVVWVMIVNASTLKSLPARKYLDGEPIMVIHNGRILEKNLGGRYYNINDLLMELRENGVFDPGEVQVGVAEPDGKLSILKKDQFQPATAKDLNLPSGAPDFNYTVGKELIIDGKVIGANLQANNLDEGWLRRQLAGQGVTDVSQVMLAEITPQGTLYVDTHRDYAPTDQKQ